MRWNEVRRFLDEWSEPSANSRRMLQWMQREPYTEYMQRVVSALENGLAVGNRVSKWSSTSLLGQASAISRGGKRSSTVPKTKIAACTKPMRSRRFSKCYRPVRRLQIRSVIKS